MPEQILLSKRQAAQVISISVRTLDKLIHSGKLPTHKIGRRVLISRAAIERFVIEGERLRRVARSRAQRAWSHLPQG
jgi:excisionase family DNA binding protein